VSFIANIALVLLNPPCAENHAWYWPIAVTDEQTVPVHYQHAIQCCILSGFLLAACILFDVCHPCSDVKRLMVSTAVKI